jgi:hypothetical protein
MKPKLLAAPMLLACLLTAMLSGCGQVAVFGHTIGENNAAPSVRTESSSTEAATSPVVAPQIQTVRSVALALTPQAQAKVTEDPRFNTDALLTAIKSELQTRKVLDTNSPTNNVAEIIIDDFTMRPTSNVILFGNIISNGTIKGEIHLRDNQGSELKNFGIEAKTRLSIPANGESKNPLEPLYRQFAVMTADSLTGTVTKPSTPEIQPPR